MHCRWPSRYLGAAPAVSLSTAVARGGTITAASASRAMTFTHRNALFTGNDGGAVHWAIAMTLIQTAKVNNVNPMAYLTDVLERIVS